jgi:UDP-3-O-[3-hydroxymyristoyl] N-acetylglucosamine deacetylase
VRDGDRRIRIEPARSLRISYLVEFDHPAIGRQAVQDLEISEEVFEREICRARTFGFLREVEALWSAGLARGGSLDNTVVLDETRVLNRDGLRCADEFVRHKVLDLLGDLALLGMPLQGHVQVERGGHAVHQRLIAELVRDPGAWRILASQADESIPAPAVLSEPMRLRAAGG